MRTSRLFLTGIGASGHHGANPGEKDRAQDFVVDLDVEVEVTGDEIGATSDYRALIRTVRETVSASSFDLLENVADAVASAVAAEPGVLRATAVVHKPAAATSNEVQGVAAGASAERVSSPDGDDSVRSFLALGSNLGDRLATLQRAVDRLAATEGIRVVRSSQVYESEPIGPPQPEYLNAVIEVATELDPRALLRAVQDVETSLGRVRGERWGPRTIDVDILTFGDREIDEPDLVVPHPRMHERSFVLLPLGELEADPKLPGGRSMSRLRLGPDSMLGVEPFAPPLRVP